MSAAAADWITGSSPVMTFLSLDIRNNSSLPGVTRQSRDGRTGRGLK